MPIVPPIAGKNPYDVLEDTLNLARIRINDAIDGLDGDILQDAQPFTQPLVNAAWRRMQLFLDNLGYSRFRQQAVIYNIPACESNDPGIQPYISYTQYFDGVNYWPNVYLPQTMMFPLKIMERPTALGSTQLYVPMHNAIDGFQTIPYSCYNGVWQWRQDTLFLGGSNVPMDLKIEGSFFLPDFVTVAQTDWTQQQVPIARGSEALSLFICYEAAALRDDLTAQSYLTQAENAARLIMNRDVRPKQRTNCTRRPFGQMSRRAVGLWRF